MRKLKLLKQPQLVAFPDSQGSRAPFPDAIHSQDSGRIEWTGEKSAGRVAFVVIGEDGRDRPSAMEFLGQSPAHVQLVLEPERHGQAEALETRRGVSQVRLEKPIKLGQGLIVKSNIANLIGAQAGFFEAI